MHTIIKSFTATLAPALAMALAALPTAGCQSYEPRPLDMTATRQNLAERSAQSREVAEFAQRMAQTDPGMAPERFDPADGLSLPEAEVVALVYNPQLRVARLEAGVAKATADTAGIWEDPVTGFNLNDVLQRNGGVTMGAQFSLTIPISGRLEAERTRATAAYAAMLSDVGAAEWRTRVELRNAWAEWSTEQDRIGVVQTTLRALDSLTEIADRMERIGETPRVEARLFRIEQAALRAELARLRGSLQAHEVAIKRIMGIAAWHDVNLVPALPPEPPAGSAPEWRDSLVERNPVIAALRAAYEVAEKALATEIRKQYPDLEIGPSYNTDGNEDFVFGVQFPLPLWNHNQQGVAQALAQREVARAQFTEAVELQLAELQAAAADHAGAREQRRLLEETVVPLVDTQAIETARIAQLGEVNTLLQLQTLTQSQQTKLALIDARKAEWLALLRMDLAIGPPPAPPPAPPSPAAPATTRSP